MITKALSVNGIKTVMPLEFDIVSPVHIGTREGSLTSIEYSFNKGHTHFIDEDLLGKFLLSNNLIDEFIERVRSEPLSLIDFLKEHNVQDVDKVLKNISRKSVSGGNSKMKRFRPFVRDAHGDVYIPGSSIKGALRTGLLYSIMKGNDELKKSKEEWIKDNLNNLNTISKERDKKIFSEKILQEDILQKFQIPNATEAPHKDMLRCLTVRDAYPVGPVQAQTKIIEIRFLSKSSSESFYWSTIKKNKIDTGIFLSVWVEALISGRFHTELIWDDMLAKQFDLQNLNISSPYSLIKNIFDTNTDIMGFEKNHFPSTKPPASAYVHSAVIDLHTWYTDKQTKDHLRFGFGSGMLSTTIDLLFSQETRARIRNICGDDRNNDPAPKTRRVWRDDLNNKWLPMGWVLVKPNKEKTSVKEKSAVEILLEELSMIRPNEMGRLGTIIQKIDNLDTLEEKALVAGEIKIKLGPKAYKHHKRRDYLDKLINMNEGE